MKTRHIRLVTLVILVVTLVSALSLVSQVSAPYRGYEYLIEDFMELANTFPDLMTYETVGKTVMNKDIIMFKIGNPRGGRVLFDGAIHGGETIGPELMYFYAKWLLTNNDPLTQHILSGTCTMLIPALNVDRYSGPRKNANGVDLNRNFASNWNQAGSTDPDNESYRGPSPLSEPESQTLIHVFQTFSPHFYVNLHMWAGPYYGGSSYGNRTYYSVLTSKIDSLGDERGVAPFRYSGQLSGAGFAISDATNAGVTSFLIELAETAIPYSDIETVLLPRFIPLAAVLSQECETRTLFEDSFEYEHFTMWSGRSVTAGDNVTITDKYSFKGFRGAKFEAGSSASGTKRAYIYKNINESSFIYARGYFYIAESLPLIDNDDRFTLIQFLGPSGSGICDVQVRRIQGEARFCLYGASGSTSWITQSTTAIMPKKGTWYSIEMYAYIHATSGAYNIYIDGTERLGATGINTIRYGNVVAVDFGLVSSVNIQQKMVVFCDCVAINTSYIGTEERADINDDGTINILDAALLGLAWLATSDSPRFDIRCDLNSDGTINIRDVAIFVSAFAH